MCTLFRRFLTANLSAIFLSSSRNWLGVRSSAMQTVGWVSFPGAGKRCSRKFAAEAGSKHRAHPVHVPANNCCWNGRIHHAKCPALSTTRLAQLNPRERCEQVLTQREVAVASERCCFKNRTGSAVAVERRNSIFFINSVKPLSSAACSVSNFRVGWESVSALGSAGQQVKRLLRCRCKRAGRKSVGFKCGEGFWQRIKARCRGGFRKRLHRSGKFIS